ncbi:MAG: AAA family ATPase [Symploca sp. SIO2E9]|nr:AAA family ATPase [Symploca sp. SIO2E9]
MMERLLVENFVGIKKLDIELKKINILIGPQASGKSVCAKLLFYFKDFVHEIISTAEDNQTKRKLDSFYSGIFKEYFPSELWGNDNFKIKYEVGNHFIEVAKSKNSKSRLDLNYSDSYKKELASLRKIFKKFRDKQADSEGLQNIDLRSYLRMEIFTHLHNNFGNIVTLSQVFIPAGRSFFANLQNNIFSFLSNEIYLDPFLEQFGSTYENIKNIRNRVRADFERNQIKNEIDKLVEEILCGRYVYEKGEDLLEILDGRKISISNSSSGQQETLPLAIMLSTLPFLSLHPSGQTVYIEEPEAHLFPNAQRNVVELIATVFNYRRERFQFVITTHSPYILTAINNLLQAGLIYRESNLEQSNFKKLQSIMPQDKALNIEDIAVYSLENGTCKTIISEETGLIDTNIIDKVSDDLAIEFDKLLEFT